MAVELLLSIINRTPFLHHPRYDIESTYYLLWHVLTLKLYDSDPEEWGKLWQAMLWRRHETVPNMLSSREKFLGARKFGLRPRKSYLQDGVGVQREAVHERPALRGRTVDPRGEA